MTQTQYIPGGIGNIDHGQPDPDPHKRKKNKWENPTPKLIQCTLDFGQFSINIQ